MTFWYTGRHNNENLLGQVYKFPNLWKIPHHLREKTKSKQQHQNHQNSTKCFTCAFRPSVCLLSRNVCLDLLPTFWLGCLFVCLFLMIASSCLYILEINPCSVASLEDTFYHSVGYLFVVVVVVFFAVQKFLSLIKSHLVIFIFIFIALGRVSKKILLRFMSKSVWHEKMLNITNY